jgi:L-histidine Nalpha-methyltransferase
MRPAILSPGRATAATHTADLQTDVLSGLARTPKRLPSKYFYDATGSALFERICEQPEYYLTRVELALMQEHAESMAAALGPGLRLIEFGSGAGIKTQLLLRALQCPVAYLPVEISADALAASIAQLAQAFPQLECLPVCADFSADFELPRASGKATRSAVYFPGSTLGNFDAAAAIELLSRMRRLVGADGAVLIGLDLKKDRATLEAAYNDAAGVTAAFTLNLLERINRELGADFDRSSFRHRAVYNVLAGRIETHIVSRAAQQVQVAGHRFAFAADEAMAVEISCKYDHADVERMAVRAGLRVERCWSDGEDRFAVFLLASRKDLR